MTEVEVQRTARRSPMRKSATTRKTGKRLRSAVDNQRSEFLRLCRSRIKPADVGLIKLLTVPAIVMNLRWDVLAWNRVNALIYRDYATRAPTDRNLLEILLTRPVHHMSREQLETAAQRMVARLRFDYSRCS